MIILPLVFRVFCAFSVVLLDYSCYYLPLLPLENKLQASLCGFLSDTVESYNLKKNEWTFVTSMVEPHYGHAGTVHGGLMYISGETTQPEIISCII